ncbi:MAG TPA: transglycosylase SLT domain-containing protein [Methylomirabilota bacterium]|nr:transglycosylase SLT domain-containing protein [Methylomirabilota bacterium]
MWPLLRSLARGLRRTGVALLAAPLAVRIAVLAVALVVLWSAANWTYQVIRKPSELFFPVSGRLTKAPAETWRSYAPLFRRHATATIPPELLAALAQVEAAGDPVARTYWRWQVAWHPFEVYRPASSAVGMYQITDPTFREARRYCVRDHVVIEDGCWFRGLYTRVLPSHAVELTAALLDRQVARTLERHRVAAAPARQKQDLAAFIHLCGEGAGAGYARRGFRLAPGQRCGDHDPARYLAQVNGMKRQFARLAAAEPVEPVLSSR